MENVAQDWKSLLLRTRRSHQRRDPHRMQDTKPTDDLVSECPVPLPPCTPEAHFHPQLFFTSYHQGLLHSGKRSIDWILPWVNRLEIVSQEEDVACLLWSKEKIMSLSRAKASQLYFKLIRKDCSCPWTGSSPVVQVCSVSFSVSPSAPQDLKGGGGGADVTRKLWDWILHPRPEKAETQL